MVAHTCAWIATAPDHETFSFYAFVGISHKGIALDLTNEVMPLALLFVVDTGLLEDVATSSPSLLVTRSKIALKLDIKKN